jgi:beta-aspartyl-peptidase (threonine type)
MSVLMAGGSALDAVVATIRRVEANPEDHSVGYGGLPNLLGEVELDASIMDGSTLATGAVASMRNYQDAIDAARTVMDTLPHVLIVGRGAEMLAQESGLPMSDLLTPAAREIWETRIDATDAYSVAMRDRATRLTSDVERPLESHGTVNVIARDAHGNIASGVSTSGWAWKYQGRVGDSPIIGAGNYADQRFGAAACTGRGEMAQRLCTAHSVVTFMRCGMTLDQALQRAAEDLHELVDPFWGEVNIVAMDREGQHSAVSTVPDKTYAAMDMTMSEPVLLERKFVAAP